MSSTEQIESDYGFLGEVKMNTRSGSRGSITSMPDKHEEKKHQASVSRRSNLSEDGPSLAKLDSNVDYELTKSPQDDKSLSEIEEESHDETPV